MDQLRQAAVAHRLAKAAADLLKPLAAGAVPGLMGRRQATLALEPWDVLQPQTEPRPPRPAHPPLRQAPKRTQPPGWIAQPLAGLAQPHQHLWLRNGLGIIPRAKGRLAGGLREP